jgi:energy-coupling factor transporter ATP-binding protein EcfA2
MPSTTFSHLEMELSKRDLGGYSLAFRFRACGSDADNRTDRFPFDLDRPGLKRLLEKAGTGEVEIGEYGSALTKQVFSDEQTLQKWSDYFASAQRLNCPLRIQLTVSENAPELHEIIWETLCNPENDQMLTTDENIWFSRYLPSQDRRPVQPGRLEDLQLVAAAANPSNLVDSKFAPVDVDGEIERACRPFDVVKPLILPRGNRKVTLQNLLDEIRSGAEVVYLACHGYLVDGNPMLVLEDDQGKLSRVSGAEFVDEIKKLARVPRLMVFASCESAGKQHAGALSTLGPMLAQAGVPAVLAMHGKISMETVEIFTPAFLREAQRDGQIDRALAVARNATRNRHDFWVPVLFLRSESGKLWNLVHFSGDKEIQKYLKALVNYCNKLPYRTLRNISDVKSLDEIYIPTRFAPIKQAEYIDDAYKQDEKNALSIEGIFRKAEPRHVLIVGEAGAGKSTILHQIAKSAWHEPEKVGLTQPHLPLLLSLRALASAQGHDLEERILDAMGKTGITLTQKLPDGFFETWPEQKKTNWLLLLDGLDEVPESETDTHRIELLELLRDIYQEHDSVRMVITSRASGIKPGELNEKLFSCYGVLPFTPEQIGQLAKRWFDAEAGVFLQAVTHTHVPYSEVDSLLLLVGSEQTPAFSQTPLLFTIAAKVFRQRKDEYGKGSLPDNQAELYKEAVEILRQEAKDRDLPRQLNEIAPGLTNIAWDILLAYLAWEMSQKRAHTFSKIYLAEKVQALLMMQFPALGEIDAHQRSLQFIQLMGERSGILVQNGKTFTWIHPTFQEYLTARYIVDTGILEKEMEEDSVPMSIGWNRMDSSWNAITTFVLEILINKGRDTTTWIRAFRNTQGPLDAGKMLLKRGRCDPLIVQKIIDEIVELVRQDWRGGASVSLLTDLCFTYTQAKDGFLKLIYANSEDELRDGFVREEAIISLGKAGYADGLFDLAVDPQLQPYLRQDAAATLSKIPGQTEKTARAYLAIAQDDNLDAWYPDEFKTHTQKEKNFYQRLRLDAAKVLGTLPGWSDTAANLLLDFVKDKDSDFFEIMDVVKILAEMRQLDKLKEVAKDNDIDFYLRMKAVIGILEAELQQQDNAWLFLEKLYMEKEEEADQFFDRFFDEEKLIAFVRNENEDLRKRFWIVVKIIGEDIKTFDSQYVFFQVVEQSGVIARSFAENLEVEPYMREFALEFAGITSSIISEILEFANDNNNHLDERLHNLRGLSFAGREDLLTDLINDRNLDSEIRLRAADLVVKGKLQKYDLSTERFLAIAYDMQENIYVRFSAAFESFRTLDEHALDEALNILLAMLCEADVDDNLLRMIVQALEHVGDSRCLPDLERVLQEHPDENIRQATDMAIQAIRQRENPQE